MTDASVLFTLAKIVVPLAMLVSLSFVDFVEIFASPSMMIRNLILSRISMTLTSLLEISRLLHHASPNKNTFSFTLWPINVVFSDNRFHQTSQ